LTIFALEPGFRLAALVVGSAVFGLLLWASGVSRREGEPQAAVRLGVMAFLSPIPFLVPLFLPAVLGVPLAVTLMAVLALVSLTLLLPLPGRNLQGLGNPVPGVDERDIMFSRATLVPGTNRFEEYYRSRPRNRELDDKFRAEPGLLSPGSAHFHRLGFAAADAAFWTIEMMRPLVEGGVIGVDNTAEDPSLVSGTKPPPSGTEPPVPGTKPPASGMEPPPSGTKLGGESAVSVGGEGVSNDPGTLTSFLKGWTLKMGAHSVGVAELKDYHLYTHVGRGSDYGDPVDLDHPYALAFTVEMDKEMVDRAPRSPTAMESALQYLRAGAMAIQVADMIRRLGFRARAHVDGNYRVICPLVARDAGLGEFGRMGLLLTPSLGPRVRIAVVTTDLPLLADSPASDLTTIDFCIRCKKCADSCPSRAISFDSPAEDENGVLRWRIDSEACFTLWGRLGTDCARCMAVCPYSHPDNAMHSLVRWGIRNNGLFRKGALWMDDFVYGRRPAPKKELDWMEAPESKGRPSRTTS